MPYPERRKVTNIAVETLHTRGQSSVNTEDFRALHVCFQPSAVSCEYTVFTTAQLLIRWNKQRPSNQVDLDSSDKGETRTAYHKGTDLLLF